jgi:hypothetical protein
MTIAEKNEYVINTNLRENGVLEIYHGNKLLCCVGDGTNDETFVENILYGLGYQWNEDGTITRLDFLNNSVARSKKEDAET